MYRDSGLTYFNGTNAIIEYTDEKNNTELYYFFGMIGVPEHQVYVGGKLSFNDDVYKVTCTHVRKYGSSS